MADILDLKNIKWRRIYEMSIEYLKLYNVKQVNELEVYCGLEGVDPQLIRRISKEEKGKLKPKSRRILRNLFRKWIENIKISRLPAH